MMFSKTFVWWFALAGVLHSAPLLAVCPGDNAWVFTDRVLRSSTNFGGPGPLHAFIGGGCGTNKIGSNTSNFTCHVNSPVSGSAYYARLSVRFNNATSNTTGRRCEFACGNGSCVMQGGDGLPVELMEFSIGEGEFSEEQ